MSTLFTRTPGARRYRLATQSEVLEIAAAYITQNAVVRGDKLSNPSAAREVFQQLLAGRTSEGFAVAFLDNRHRAIAVEIMFNGTIDGASVYPREVVKRALDLNAAAIIIAHNHPSGEAEPSHADELITNRLRDACALVDVRLLDHLVVTATGCVSFAERGRL